ncbi:MAG: FlgD immunoglobulin-like domain containing protein, partial [bacterium]
NCGLPIWQNCIRANVCAYYKAFFLPQGLPRDPESCYSFDYGNVHFISYNIGLSRGLEYRGSQEPGSPRYEWLRADLQSSSNSDWIVFFCHEQFYSQGTHGSPGGGNPFPALIELFDNYNVDAVIYAHSHVYERTKLLKNGGIIDNDMHDYDKTDNGVIYITNGIGGNSSGTGSISVGGIFAAAHASWPDSQGFVYVEIHGDTMSGKFVRQNGDILDHWTLTKPLSTVKNKTHKNNKPYLTIYPAMPNPFSSYTKIRYAATEAGSVTISIFNLKAQLVRRWNMGRHMSGVYTLTWDGTDKLGRTVVPGSYLCEIVQDGFKTNRIVYLIQ